MNIEDILPPPFEWVEIPGGIVMLEAGGYLKEPTTFDVSAFAIAKYPITNAQFARFVEAEGYRQRKWWTEAGWQQKEREDWREPRFWQDMAWNGMDYPVVGVSWYEAMAFCQWLTARLLPSSPTLLPEGEGKERFRELASRAMVKIAKELRQRETNAEDILWEYLRNRRLGEIKFRRQHPVAGTNYIVDFFSYENRLVIELDGGVHEQHQAADAERQREIETLGYRVLRFRNEQVFNDLENVLRTILYSVLSLDGEGARAITLPTEQQWQRAAQGDDERIYPWGNEFDRSKCNTFESGIGHTMPVMCYLQGSSPYEVMDMSGNVWEWCATEWDTGETALESAKERCLRGGSWFFLQHLARASTRERDYPYGRFHNRGFRVCLSFA